MEYKEKIKNFLEKKSDLRKIIVIYGPTASWKTWMSIEIAKIVDSEIISTDSRQIFKGLDIWTGKITEEEKEGIVHHMIDIINPDREYSVWEFKEKSEKIIWEIYSKWKIPILCWGTWLYIDSLIYNFNIPRIPADEKLRASLEKEAEENWNEFVYNKLKDIDPEYAKELHPNNIRYIIRAIEVKMLTWKSKRDFREEKTLKYDTLFLTPYLGEREYLYNRINKRVQMMFDDGLVWEVEELLKTYTKDNFWMKTIWYKEVINYLNWDWKVYDWSEKLELWEKEKQWIKLNLDETIELVKKNNRNYAKKQLTWFRKYEE
jgi:tRNA dimethylallyltransferase